MPENNEIKIKGHLDMRWAVCYRQIKIEIRAVFQQWALFCGVLSSLFHVGMDVIGGTRWQHYSWISQEFSQLSAVGAPSRPIHLVLACIYAVLVTAFGLGVWWAAGRRRALRAVGILLVIFAVNSWVWPQFFPEDFSKSVSAFTNTMHIILAAVTVLSILLQIGFGATASGRGFRLYSIGTFLTVLAFGASTGPQSAARIAGLPAPWLGLTERINIYGYMLWVAVLAIVLIRAQPKGFREEDNDCTLSARNG
jgi:hypothetical protein